MMMRPTVTMKALIPVDKKPPWGGSIFTTVGHESKIMCCEQRDN